LKKILKLKIYLKKKIYRRKKKPILKGFKYEFYAFYYQDLKLLKKNENLRVYKKEYMKLKVYISKLIDSYLSASLSD
jgi:hypothetical protein